MIAYHGYTIAYYIYTQPDIYLLVEKKKASFSKSKDRKRCENSNTNNSSSKNSNSSKNNKISVDDFLRVRL